MIFSFSKYTSSYAKSNGNRTISNSKTRTRSSLQLQKHIYFHPADLIGELARTRAPRARSSSPPPPPLLFQLDNPHSVLDIYIRAGAISRSISAGASFHASLEKSQARQTRLTAFVRRSVDFYYCGKEIAIGKYKGLYCRSSVDIGMQLIKNFGELICVFVISRANTICLKFACLSLLNKLLSKYAFFSSLRNSRQTGHVTSKKRNSAIRLLCKLKSPGVSWNPIKERIKKPTHTSVRRPFDLLAPN